MGWHASLEPCLPTQNPSACTGPQTSPLAHVLAWDPTPLPVWDPSTYLLPQVHASMLAQAPICVQVSKPTVNHHFLPARQLGTYSSPFLLCPQLKYTRGSHPAGPGPWQVSCLPAWVAEGKEGCLLLLSSHLLFFSLGWKYKYPTVLLLSEWKWVIPTRPHLLTKCRDGRHILLW